MGKSITVIKLNQEHISDLFKDGLKTDFVFREVQRDTIGKSGSNPTWGYTFYNDGGKMKFSGIALHKEFDYDYPMAAYGEKVWSIFGQELIGESVRVPKIEIVEQTPGCEDIISYRILDNDTEDMIHIKETLFNKFEREEIKSKKEIYTIDEILECVKGQIENEDNYKKVEKDIIQVLLLDAITNNGDRHVLNWGLVREEKNNNYSLAVFDHSSAFVDMFEDKSYFIKSGWANTYVTVGEDRGKTNIGSDGKKVIDYVAEEYPEYFNEFCDNFNEKLPKILEEVKKEKMKIDFNRLQRKMQERRYYLKKVKNKGEYEYE